MRSTDLEIGQIYFGLAFEDDELTRPLIKSYEYLGVNIEGGPPSSETLFCFRFVGSDDIVELTGPQLLDVVHDVPGIADELKRWSQENKKKDKGSG